MACRTIRSEYMKKFKDPKWETFRKCYEEMLIYRISRRILEQAHIPWFWNGQDDSDSESVEIKQTPSAGQNQVEAEQVHCGGAKTIPRLLLQEQEQENELSVRKTTGSPCDGEKETRVPEEEEEVRGEERMSGRGSKKLSFPNRNKPPERHALQQMQQATAPTSSKHPSHPRHHVRTAPAQQNRGDSKKSRHSFALYASGQLNTDISDRKTHNVGPAMSTNQIHESALRAKTRRQIERQISTKRTERRKSAIGDKGRQLLKTEFNPWLTEYMHCFSVHSQVQPSEIL